MSNVAEKSKNFVEDLGDAARKNPLSAALIGMGILWLFTSGRSVETAGDFARNRFNGVSEAAGNAFESSRSNIRSGANSIGNGVASAADALQDGAADALDKASRLGREQASAVSDYAGSLSDTGAEMFGNVRSNLTEIFKAQPLALGAIGLAIGAGMAAALPRTDIEADYLGETSETVKKKATEFAAEQTDRATKVADDVIGAVAEEARKQGLTFDAAKSTVGDISKKAGRVVDAAGKRISDRGS